MLEKHHHVPYTFQNAQLAGKYDILGAFWEDNMSLHEKEEKSIQLVNVMIPSILEQKVMGDLSKFLTDNLLTFYLEKVPEITKDYLEEGVISNKGTFDFAVMLATKSDQAALVKLGILLLGLFNNKVSKNIAKVLGLHSEFTLYALEAAKYYDNRNELVYELAKNTRGYGKLAAVYVFHPITMSQKRWLLEYGPLNEAVPALSAIICLNKPGNLQYYESCLFTRSNFSRYSYLFAYALQRDDAKKFGHIKPFLISYVESAKMYSKLFIDIAAIVMIHRSMDSKYYKRDFILEMANGWTTKSQEELRQACSMIMSQSFWKDVILAEVVGPYLLYTNYLMIQVFKDMDIAPDFKQMRLLLTKDTFDVDVLELVLIDQKEYYWKDVYLYLQENLPDDVFDGEIRVIQKEELSGEYKPDIWLLYLLKVMVERKEPDMDFYLKCLSARFQDSRSQAVEAIRVISTKLSSEVIMLLTETKEKELVDTIRQQIEALIEERE